MSESRQAHTPGSWEAHGGPELLGACEWARTIFRAYLDATSDDERNWHIRDVDHALDCIEKAIAKAKGA